MAAAYDYLDPDLGYLLGLILWGHPNLRSPTPGSGWAKEHRLRVFPEDFQKVGFQLQLKQEAFEQLLAANTKMRVRKTKPCNPKERTVGKRKPKHPDEHSPKLHPKARRHFNCYWKLCQALGCKQGKRRQKRILVDEDD